MTTQKIEINVTKPDHVSEQQFTQLVTTVTQMLEEIFALWHTYEIAGVSMVTPIRNIGFSNTENDKTGMSFSHTYSIPDVEVALFTAQNLSSMADVLMRHGLMNIPRDKPTRVQ